MTDTIKSIQADNDDLRIANLRGLERFASRCDSISTELAGTWWWNFSVVCWLDLTELSLDLRDAYGPNDVYLAPSCWLQILLRFRNGLPTNFTTLARAPELVTEAWDVFTMINQENEFIGHRYALRQRMPFEDLLTSTILPLMIREPIRSLMHHWYTLACLDKLSRSFNLARARALLYTLNYSDCTPVRSSTPCTKLTTITLSGRHEASKDSLIAFWIYGPLSKRCACLSLLPTYPELHK